jgi:hypothetical protein
MGRVVTGVWWSSTGVYDSSCLVEEGVRRHCIDGVSLERLRVHSNWRIGYQKRSGMPGRSSGFLIHRQEFR